MNKIHRRVWSASRHAYVAVAETARTRGKSSGVSGALLASFLFASTGAEAQSLANNTLPTGAQVTGGQVQISTKGADMAVQQSTQRAAINWQSFNIGSDASVTFAQPNAQAVTLNRVVGTERSIIEGALSANGNVYILNANGVLFNRNAQVNVGGLVASTRNLSDADFMAGRTTFSATGSGSGSVINLGTLTAADGGHIALLGQKVRNEGVITARLGSVALAAGDKITLDFNGNSLVKVTVDAGTLGALVENRHAVLADGGLVTLTAKGLDEVMRTVVNNSGEVRAQTIANKAGRIYLLGGMDNNRIEVGGTLDASAPNGGNGGFVETSAAKVAFQADRQITTHASQGQTGTFLIDPNDYTVATSGADISGAQLSTDLANNNVQISTATQGTAGGNGDIFVNDAVTWNSGNTLTLRAQRNIQINATVDASAGTGGKLVLQYGMGAVAAGNTAQYSLGLTQNGFTGKVKLQAGQNFDTQVGSDGANVPWRVITQLGQAGDEANAGAVDSLQSLANAAHLTGNYVLGADIDASSTATWNGGAGFVPIGSGNSMNSNTLAFRGSLDGLGNSLSGLTINQAAGSTDPVGLFGSVSRNNAVSFRHIDLANLSLTGSSSSEAVGGLIGSVYARNTTTNPLNVEFVRVSGQVTSQDRFAGGVIGNIDVSGPLNLKNIYGQANVSASTSYAGGVIGRVYRGAVVDIAHVHGSGNVEVGALNGTTGTKAGALFGSLDGAVGNITDVSATGTVTGYRGNGSSAAMEIGGVFGVIYGDRSLSSSYMTHDPSAPLLRLNQARFSGDVSIVDPNPGSSNASRVGGMFGYAYKTVISDAAVAPGVQVQAGPYIDSVGGLAGYAEQAVFLRSTTSAVVSGGNDVGGLIGRAHQTIARQTASLGASVTGINNVGGLIGQSRGGSTTQRTQEGGVIDQSYAISDVSGVNYVGGLLGRASSDGYQGTWPNYSVTNNFVKDSYASGAVVASNGVAGGLVGTIADHPFGAGTGGVQIDNSLARGSVTGTTAGGLVGSQDPAVTASNLVNNSYWDVTISGLGTSGSGNNSAGGMGKTTAQMQDILTFRGMNPNTPLWSIAAADVSDPYPALRWSTGASDSGPVWVMPHKLATSVFDSAILEDGNTNTAQSTSGLAGTLTLSNGQLSLISDLSALAVNGYLASDFKSHAKVVDADHLEVVKPFTWNGYNLTLSAQNNIRVLRTIGATGASDKLTLEYGQNAVASGNTASYDFGMSDAGFAGRVNLQSGANFSTQLGTDGNVGALTAVNYQVINSRAELEQVTNPRSYALGGDIDLSAANWMPLGNFSGFFDGLGHTISGMNVNTPSVNEVGLFSGTYLAQMANLHLAGSVTGNRYTGGLSGIDSGSVMKNIISDVQVHAHNRYSGGLVGYAGDSTFHNILARGTVHDTSSAGNARYLGGLAGQLNLASIEQVHVSGNVVGGAQSQYIGGLAGYRTYSEINNSFVTGNVSGGAQSIYVGGLTGYDSSQTNYTGNLAHYTTKNVYTTGSVTGGDFVGGLFGYSDKTYVENAYAAGRVALAAGATGTNIGGFVGAGRNAASGRPEPYFNPVNSFWDVQTTGQSSAGILPEAASSYGVQGKNTADLQTLGTFSGTTPAWNIAGAPTGAYPVLRWASSLAQGGASTWVIINPVVSVNYNLGSASGSYVYNGTSYNLGDVWSAANLFGNHYSNWLVGTDYTFQYNGASVTGFTNAGAYSGITIAINRTGFAVANSGNTAGSLTITPKTLTLSANKVYDGRTALNASHITLGGLVGNETLGISSAVGHGANVGAGNYISGLTLNNGAGLASNYQLPSTLNANTAALTITPKTLSVSGTTAHDKTYDGSTQAQITVGTLAGLVGNETLNVSASGQFGSANAGSQSASARYIVTNGSNGGLASNYQLADTNGHSATISPKTLSVSGTTASDKTYDGSTQATVSVGQISGVVVNEPTPTVQASGQFDSANPGPRTVLVHYAVNNPNYQLADEPVRAQIVLQPAISNVRAQAAKRTLLAPESGQIGGNTSDVLLPASFVVRNAAEPLSSANVQTPVGNVMQVPNGVNIAAANLVQGDALSVVSSPNANDSTALVTLSQARAMTSVPGAAAGTREVRVPVSRNSLAEIVNGGVRLPSGVEQQLFVVKK